MGGERFLPLGRGGGGVSWFLASLAMVVKYASPTPPCLDHHHQRGRGMCTLPLLCTCNPPIITNTHAMLHRICCSAQNLCKCINFVHLHKFCANHMHPLFCSPWFVDLFDDSRVHPAPAKVLGLHMRTNLPFWQNSSFPWCCLIFSSWIHFILRRRRRILRSSLRRRLWRRRSRSNLWGTNGTIVSIGDVRGEYASSRCNSRYMRHLQAIAPPLCLD